MYDCKNYMQTTYYMQFIVLLEQRATVQEVACLLTTPLHATR